ncbi:hypothetical protein FHU33_0509 [Blastococcus colisei]|uniref:ArsR family transcriptional regulator n=1 Tax=Blastococcus colisei TaxID=1564162 RepID=A0A543PAX8_9ACTN|nr:hypothetical protein FHU33_0509 [Blastococcus colisei]
MRDLEAEGYLVRARRGRRTHYALRPHQPFRHPTTADHEIDELLGLFTPGQAAEPTRRAVAGPATRGGATGVPPGPP